MTDKLNAETLRAQADVLRASVITFGGVQQTRLGEKSADAILTLLTANEQMAERVAKLERALRRCAEIVDRNLYRQSEKVEDVPHIARAALRGNDA